MKTKIGNVFCGLMSGLLRSAMRGGPPAAEQPTDSAPLVPTPRLPGRRPRLVALLTLAAGLLLGTNAEASHFRGASLTWKRLVSPANTIEVTVTEAWRTGAVTGQSWVWGDNQTFSTSSDFTVIATGSDYTVIRKVFTHTYSTEGPWTILGSSGARVGTLVNSANSNWRLAAVVDLRSGNQGCPVITSPIILQMTKGGLNTVPLSFADVDGDPVTFRMATSAESAITTLATAGGQSIAVSPAGVLTWNTASTLVGQVYAVQVIANDNHPLSPSGAGTTSVLFDFIVQIVDGTLNQPPVASGNAGPFTAAIGQPFSNVITGTDPDGGNLTVTHQGLPVGATLTPASGTTAPQPLAATFSWTPTLADAGSSVGVTILFTDPTGLQASKSFSISVPANQPPIANAGPDQTIYDIDGNGVPITVTLNGSASYDPESEGLTYAWTQIGGTPTVTLANPNGASPSFTAPSLATHPNGEPIPLQLTFRLDVSDGKTTRSDDVMIIVKHNNLAPVAVATAPATAPEGSAVTLDGSGSSDPDQDPLSYTWTQTAGTPVSFLNNGGNNPLMTISHVVPGPHSIAGETLEFTVTVSDGIATSTSVPMQVFIKNVNTAPIANAGDDDTVCDDLASVSLAGSGFDFDGDALSFKWTQASGPAVVLNGADTATPTFTPPAVAATDGSATLTFKLTVSDAIDANDAEALTGESAVNVLVKHSNHAPIADAGQSKVAPELTTVTLDGSGSFDPDTDPIASYHWTQTSGPAVTLNGDTTATPSFTAPDVGPAGVTLTFQLVVTDAPRDAFCGASLASAPSSVSVFVQYVNRAPIANAGLEQTADEGNIVKADGSLSSDPDGNAITYAWAQISGPTATLSDATAASPTFTAPAVTRLGDTMVFELKVTDEFGLPSSAATTSVHVNNVNRPPVADAGMLQSVPENTSVNLAGLGFDPDTEEQSLLTYAWVQTIGPVVTLSDANTSTPSFLAPMVTAGGDPSAKVTLKFILTVTDPNGATGSAETTVTVANVDHAPTANAGGIRIANEAATVTLDGTASSDPDNDPIGYAWVQTDGPAVVLANANTATPSFTAPFVNAAGAVLKFKLTVNDGFGGTSSDTATMSIININDPPVCDHAQPSIATLWPPNHSMVKVSILGVVDANNNATINITGVTQDEATNGLGDGDTAVDAIINADGTVLLRAERSGKGNGRVYHIHFTASDFEGGCSNVVNVSVPHDKRGDVAIDGGELFDSTH